MEEEIPKLVLEKLKDWDKKALENFIKNMFDEELSEETVKKITLIVNHEFDQNGKLMSMLKTVFGFNFVFPLGNGKFAVIPVVAPTVIIKAVKNKYAVVYVFNCNKKEKECKWEIIKSDSGYD